MLCCYSSSSLPKVGYACCGCVSVDFIASKLCLLSRLITFILIYYFKVSFSFAVAIFQNMILLLCVSDIVKFKFM